MKSVNDGIAEVDNYIHDDLMSLNWTEQTNVAIYCVLMNAYLAGYNRAIRMTGECRTCRHRDPGW